MPWILLLLAIGCFVVTFLTKSFALGVVCLVLALVFVILSTMLLLSARMGAASRNLNILSPEELRALREQAEARREGAARAGANAGVEPRATSNATSEQSPPSTSA